MMHLIPTLTILTTLSVTVSAFTPAVIPGQLTSFPSSSTLFYKKGNNREKSKGESSTGTALTTDQVRQLFDLWSDALMTLDPDVVTRRYSSDAVLLPTMSNTPRTDYDSIKDYFVHFLENEPQGLILESHVTVGDSWCSDVGIYEFTMGTTGDAVKARYSFVYVCDEDGEWKISHHHSSQMPEATKSDDTLTNAQVRGLFNQWNDALSTMDPDAVAQRYSKNAVLLPTISDAPLTDYESIKDYFTSFLKEEPRGKILESQISAGKNWYKDVGVYEFSMGNTDDSVVTARYIFVYICEDGEWKISHHHSSILPDAMLLSG